MKKDGFVFVESIVVLVVVALSVALLISSYSLISRKTKEKEFYDTAGDKYLLYAISQLGSDETCNYAGVGTGTGECRVVDFVANSTNCASKKPGKMMINCSKLFEDLNVKQLIVISNVREALASNSTALSDYDNGVIEYLKTLKACRDENEYREVNGKKYYVKNSSCNQPIRYLVGEFERDGNFYYASLELNAE